MRVAARELGVTPSTISHSIGRLRMVLRDELFIPGNARMMPTNRAIEIAPAISGALDLIASSVIGPPFAPAESSRIFRVAATDYGAIIVVSRLAARLAFIAPKIQIRLFPYSRPDIVRSLDDGSADLVIGWFDDLPGRVRRNHILTEKEALLVRKGHPLADENTTTAERVLSYPFVVVELAGSGEPAVDGFLDERGVWRRAWIDRLLIEAKDNGDLIRTVAVSVPYYSAVPSMLKTTDLVATLPERLARQFASAGEHVLLDLPFRPTEIKVEAIWHERNEGDHPLQWLLGQLTEIGSTIDQD